MPANYIVTIIFFATFAIVFSFLLYLHNKRFVSIATKIVTGFFVVSTAPIIIIGLLSFQVAEEIIVKGQVSHLESIADYKVNRIENFFENLTQDLKTAQDYYNVKTNLPIVSEYIEDRESRNYISAKETLDGQLKNFQKAKGYLEFILLNTEQEIVYTTENVHTDQELENGIFIHNDKVEFSNEIVFSPIFTSDFTESGFEMLASAPAYNFESELVGYIVFAIDMGPVFDLIQDTTGLGETGETLIGVLEEEEHDFGSSHISSIEGPHSLFINTLRHDPDAALKREVEIGSSEAIPIQEATQGREGSGLSVDYRNEKIVAAWRYIPVKNWGLVAKIDSSEAFSPIIKLRDRILLVSLVLLTLVIILGQIISNSLSKPLKELTRIAEEISRGEFSKKILDVAVKSRDETGILAKGFIRMIDKFISSQNSLNDKIEELEKFQEITVDRELKIAELKRKIKILENEGK